MTPHVKASEQVVQDTKSDNVPLREWMSKTNVKMAGKENLKPVTREVGEVVKHPRSPLKELADNAIATIASGKKSCANIRFPASALGLIQGPNDSLIIKPTSLIMPKMKKGRPLGSLNKVPRQSPHVTKLDDMSVLCPNTPSSPDPKGKNKI
ncbi:hypothetical protein ACLB2K_065959 [Fragaria x ananassa]